MLTDAMKLDKSVDGGNLLSSDSVPAWYLAQHGVLLLKGADSRDFLHRMSTNDILGLKNNQTTTTVLTTEKGKIIDRLRVLACDDTLVLLTSKGMNAPVAQWLEKFVIMDNVSITDATDAYHSMTLFGKTSVAALGNVGRSFPTPPEGASVCTSQADNLRLMCWRDDLWQSDVYGLLISPISTNASPTPGHMLTAEWMQMTQDEFNRLRIEEGIPVIGKELSEQINPLEANMERFVSFAKGCYIGQEVIARIDSYGKLQKTMKGFQFEPSVNPSPGIGTIFLGDQEVGRTTSHTFSPGLGKCIALGFLKNGVIEPEFVFLEDQSGKRYPLLATSLPFGNA